MAARDSSSSVSVDDVSFQVEAGSLSTLEINLALQIRALKLPAPEREFYFMKPRRFRFDFAWPDRMVALEAEGGTWMNGRHNRGAGYESDCLKYSEAAIRGWKVIRATGKMVNDGTAIELLRRALSSQHSHNTTLET